MLPKSELREVIVDLVDAKVQRELVKIRVDRLFQRSGYVDPAMTCLLYTSDAADDTSEV